MTMQDMRLERQSKIDSYREILDAKADLGPQQRAKLDALEKEISNLDARIQRHQSILDIEAGKIARGEGMPRVGQAEAIRGLGSFYRTGRADFGFKNALTEGSDSAGMVVPHELAEIVSTQQQKFSPLRTICSVVTSQTAASRYTLPVNIGGLGSGWVGETDARGNTGTPTLAEIEFPDGEVFCNLPISQWLEEDTAIGEWLVQEIGKEFSRVEGAAFVSGNGLRKPKGFLAYATGAAADDARAFGVLQKIEAASATALASDELIDLVYMLKSAYRQNAHWIMNGLTLSKVRKLKDTTGRFLWEPGLSGQPQMLLGHPILECDDMPDVAADTVPIAFGDFLNGYRIIDRTLTVLRDPYSNKPSVNFYARKRVSGALIDSNAIKLLRMKA